jgi:acetone carboxylase gamma subunit
MKIIIVLLVLLVGVVSYGQNCTPCNIAKVKLKANGPDLFESKTQVEYGTPLCIEVSGVNTFLMKSYATYTPINFEFSTSEFIKIKLDEKVKNPTIEKNDTSLKNEGLITSLNEKLISVSSFKLEIRKNNILINKFSTDSISSDKSKDIIEELIRKNDILNEKIEKSDLTIKEITDKNKNLEEKVKSLTNINEKTIEFKEEFIKFQKHFSNVNSYTTLKKTLLEQIEKDSIFIGDTLNFKKRSISSYNAIYGIDTEPLKQKSKVTDELTNLETSYLTLVAIYQQLNNEHKNDVLKLSGELKDGDNVLKFDNISATFQTKKMFEDEMAKVKVINDKLIQPDNRNKMILEAQAGIDLYDEILNSKFTTTIISNNVYDDIATIKPQLKDNKGKVKYEYREFKVSSYGNWKINGSAGYFLNFISDDNYTIRKKIETDSNSKTGVNESNTNTFKHSLGGLLHAYYNFKGNVETGFSVGLSINDNANAGFYFGLSALVTESNRLVFTSGVSFNKVKKLNTTNLKSNSGEYNFTNESDTEIKYDEVYKPSFFIGISYNLFK